MEDIFLDCKDLNCPMPIVKISRAFKGLDIGTTLVVEATDPAFKADLRVWVEKMGHQLVDFEEKADFQRARLVKSK